jgi:apolipoprotein N-acyltransferase
MPNPPILFTTLQPMERPMEAFLLTAVAGGLQAMMGSTAAASELGCFVAIGAPFLSCLLPAVAGFVALLFALLLVPLAILLYVRPRLHKPCGAAIAGVSLLGGLLGIPWLLAGCGALAGALAWRWRRQRTLHAYPAA